MVTRSLSSPTTIPGKLLKLNRFKKFFGIMLCKYVCVLYSNSYEFVTSVIKIALNYGHWMKQVKHMAMARTPVKENSMPINQHSKRAK